MDKLPSLPTDCKVELKDGEPVFEEPWQARTFAMAVQLNEAGFFAWQEWADELSRQIAAAEKVRPVRDAAGYYQVWQTCLEHLVNRKLNSEQNTGPAGFSHATA